MFVESGENILTGAETPSREKWNQALDWFQLPSPTLFEGIRGFVQPDRSHRALEWHFTLEKLTAIFFFSFCSRGALCRCPRSPWRMSGREQLCLCVEGCLWERKSWILTEQCYDKSGQFCPTASRTVKFSRTVRGPTGIFQGSFAPDLPPVLLGKQWGRMSRRLRARPYVALFSLQGGCGGWGWPEFWLQGQGTGHLD